MDTLMHLCRSDFAQSEAGSTLSKLKTEYEQLSAEEIAENDDDLYYTGILKTLNSLMAQLNTRDEL